MVDNPLCTSAPGFRFYAGAILKTSKGFPIGTLCVLDHKPRVLSERQRKVLRVLSTHVMRELDLRMALEQEKTLRQEVDHRVKNSLASIGSMLAMKARRESNEDVRLALEDAGSRIRSLSSLHAELHELKQGELVDMRSLFRRIEADLGKLLSDSIELSIDVCDNRTTPALANAFLLIVNEFVSNSAKHGLKGGAGTIEVVIRSSDNDWSITCRDDGTGTALDAERAASGSGLGTRVIRSLAASLGASAEWRSDGAGLSLRIAS